MEMYRKASLFLKLAQTTPNRAEYEAKEKLLPTMSSNDIIKFIKTFSTYSYFNFDKVAPILAEKELKDGALSMAISWLVNILGEYADIRLKLQRYFVEYHIDHNIIISRQYINIIEPSDISEAYLRKAQTKVIKDIIDFATNNPTEKSYDASQSMLGELIDNSTKFNPQFLERLAKHLGIEYYGDLMGEKIDFI